MIISSQNHANAIGAKKAATAAALLFVIGGGIAASMALSDKSFMHSYFFGWLFFTCLTLGCLGVTLLHHTIRGAWGLSVLRLVEAGGSPAAFAAMLVGWIPIALSTKVFYPWADPAKVAGDHVLQYRSELPFVMQMTQQPWMTRTIVCFAIWMGLAYYLRKSSHAQDGEQDAAKANKMAQARTNISAPCLVLFFLTGTVAFTDWVMSIDAHWFSTMMPAWFIVGSVLTALALCNVIVMSNAKKEPYSEVMNKGLSKDLGNMLFVFSLLWAYTSFSQFVIIWAGNLPELTTFYVTRTRPVWQSIGVFLILGQFLFPFISLMSPKSKANPNILRNIALWVLLVRFVDVYWIAIPFFRPDFGVQIGDIVALAAFGALWTLVFSTMLLKGNLLPTHDPRLKEAYAHA
ncbi:MAG: hypothetical protein KF784_03500 [Fimbriimonadaceae bacterium]|nr:hypothetical protein [Fimbriimonadaceae bacterium]